MEQVELIRCPHCRQPSDRIKVYKMMKLMIFLFIGAWWRTQTYIGCPACMRKEILLKTAINLLPGNLIWLVLIQPWHLVLLALAGTEGHSKKLYEYM